MKSADDLKARLGSNMRESLGARTANTTASALHGATPAPAAPAPAKFVGAARVKDALSIEVERIAPDPDQPRKEFDPVALADLAASLNARGQLQPIRVRWSEDVSRWIIIAGERRYRAAVLAGLPSLLCVEARGEQSPEDILEDQLVENCVREDLKPIEQAHAFRALIDARSWSYRQLAEAIHVSAASVARTLALLELPAPIRDRVERGELAASVAYEISKAGTPEAQTEVAALVVDGGLNRAETVAAVKAKATRSERSRGAKAKVTPRRTSETIRTPSGCRVTFESRRGVDEAVILAALDEVRAAVVARGNARTAEGEAA